MDNATRPNDLLLIGGKIITVFMQIAMAIGAVALVIAVPLLVVFSGDIAAEVASEFGPDGPALPVIALIGIMLIGLAIVAAMFVFFGKLRQIIDTVGEGDPFAPANADRLALMGWLMLGVQLLLIPAAALGVYLASFADEIEDVHLTVDGGFDLTGILMVIVLFILARVFKHGAAMREDLEGTV